jgi:hypothetical protein
MARTLVPARRAASSADSISTCAPHASHHAGVTSLRPPTANTRCLSNVISILLFVTLSSGEGFFQEFGRV